MIDLNFSTICNIKCKFNDYRKYVNILVCSFLVLSIIYFAYWGAINCDEYIYEYTKDYMEPIAKFLNPNSMSLEIYKKTAIKFLLAIIPAYFCYSILDKLEEHITKLAVIKENFEKERQEQVEKLIEFRKYDHINSFSISMSLDFKTTGKISDETKAVLTKAIFQKLKNIDPVNAKIDYDSKTFVLNSKSFYLYDLVYLKLTSTLAKAKRVIEETYKDYGLKITPTIVTDAYSKDTCFKTIETKHFEIKNLILGNKAITTAEFKKKYQHINKSKYLGTPIGEYLNSDDKKSENFETYELNLVSSNLNKELLAF